MNISRYRLPCPESLTAALISDYHSNKRRTSGVRYARLIRDEAPDIIFATGDFFSCADSLDIDRGANADGLHFLAECRKIAPVYYVIGNHEHALSDLNKAKLTERGIRVLENQFVLHGRLAIGGISLPYIFTPNRKRPVCPPPDREFLSEFSSLDAYKILLCHHPEYWKKYLREYAVDLTVSGHAHGGQIRLFRHGLYAPGQGIFPRYTSGLHTYGTSPTRHLIVSRGMTNTVPVPRLWNPCEIVILKLGEEYEKSNRMLLR